VPYLPRLLGLFKVIRALPSTKVATPMTMLKPEAGLQCHWQRRPARGSAVAPPPRPAPGAVTVAVPKLRPSLPEAAEAGLTGQLSAAPSESLLVAGCLGTQAGVTTSELP
jgi:hypothetical protein